MRSVSPFMSVMKFDSVGGGGEVEEMAWVCGVVFCW